MDALVSVFENKYWCSGLWAKILCRVIIIRQTDGYVA